MKSLNGEVNKASKKILGKKNSKKKNKRIMFLLIANMLVILGISTIFNVSSIYAKQETKYTEKTVSNGDTLWEYASDISTETNYDIKVTSIIMDIQEINNMNSCDIVVGDTIKLPIYD